ncbi:MAG: hypothetical protein JXX29_10565 [Deltaproteobacteria bacterium]|nr:hypothetical protein [Deltaproteobacteria bacterium]MBN2672110.1 hypothetical protein [Deltaproteobacteria bacterium]
MNKSFTALFLLFVLSVGACAESSDSSDDAGNDSDLGDSDTTTQTDSDSMLQNQTDSDTNTDEVDTSSDPVGVARFVGEYVATYQNDVVLDNTGFVTAVIDANGRVTAHWPGEDVEGTGQVDPDGGTAITFGSASQDGEEVVWQGVFRVTPAGVMANGTWASSIDTNGTWQAWKRDAFNPLDAAEISNACTALVPCFQFTVDECISGLSCQILQVYAWSEECFNYFEEQLNLMVENPESCSAGAEPPDLSPGGCFENMNACYSDERTEIGL